MGKLTKIGFVSAKAAKIAIIIIILILYRIGDNGKFLGVGGTWNLNEEKTVDVEILASGVFVGTFVYTLSVLVTYILTGERLINDCIMNVIGIFTWIAVGGTALHYWDSYAIQHQFEVTGTERSFGLAVGCLCILTALIHIADTVFSVRMYLNKSEA